jgi:glucokinase
VSVVTRLSVVADVGGTHTRLAFATAANVDTASIVVFENRALESFEDAFVQFYKQHDLSQKQTLEGIAIGAAGPVVRGVCAMTNLPWKLRVAQLARRARTVVLVNDMVAHAAGIQGASLLRLTAGPVKLRDGFVVLAPGTGFGLAYVASDGGIHPTESGHVLLASEDADLARMGAGQTVEHVLSGPGLVRLHHALHRRAKKAESGRTIVQAARDGKPSAQKTLTVFARVLIAESENAILRYGARGGVVITGSLAKALAPELRAEAQRPRKPRMKPFDGAGIALAKDPDRSLFGLHRLLQESQER